MQRVIGSNRKQRAVKPGIARSTSQIRKPRLSSSKLPFNIDVALSKISEAVRPFPKAALFELYESGHRTVFEQVVACIISIRTFDEATILVSRRLFSQARTPKQISLLSVEEIDELIERSTFHEAKAKTIHNIARQVVAEGLEDLPCDREALLSIKGLGPKCTGLALGIACGQMHIAVDIHVHRVTNRWGYIEATSPEKTMAELEKRLPERYWVDINRLLVPFGKHICTGRQPHCSTCPVLEMCQQVGVTTHR